MKPKQHSSFRITPDIPRLPGMHGRMILWPRYPGASDACRLLSRLYQAKSTELRPGQLFHLELSIGSLGKDTDFPAQVINAPSCLSSRDGVALVFSDSSLLIGEYIPSRSIVRFLPAVLELAPHLATDHGAVFLKPRLTGSSVEVSLSWHFNKASLETVHISIPQLTFLKDQIQAEIGAWISAFDRAPHLVTPRDGSPLNGRFGKGTPLPNEDLRGQYYAWPDILPATGVSPAELERIRSFLHLAWIRAATDFPEARQTILMQVTVRSASPRQMGQKSRGHVTFLSTRKESQVFPLARQKGFAKLYRTLLTHPSAPDRLMRTLYTGWDLNDTEIDNVVPGAILEGRSLYKSRFNASISAHEMLAALDLFSDVPAPDA